MKNTKRNLVRDVTKKINKLPEEKKQYILGIMDGIMISTGNVRRSDSENEKR